VTKYQKRISGHMLDRIDIHIEVLRMDYEKGEYPFTTGRYIKEIRY